MVVYGVVAGGAPLPDHRDLSEWMASARLHQWLPQIVSMILVHPVDLIYDALNLYIFVFNLRLVSVKFDRNYFSPLHLQFRTW